MTPEIQNGRQRKRNSVNNAQITSRGGQKGAIWTMIQIYFGFFGNVG